VVRFPDFQTNQYLKEVASGQTHTDAQGTFWQMRLDPQTGKIKAAEELIDRGCEFPQVPPFQVGQPNRYTYLVLHRPEADVRRELFGAIARFDHTTGTLTEANLGQHRYPSEPLYAADAIEPSQGWILTVVFDGKVEQSEIWILNSDRLDGEPTCRLLLPTLIPPSFHGTWKAAG